MAAVITVSSAADPTETGQTTLRDAITAANGNGDGANTIDCSGVSGTISLASALPVITKNLTIDGPGADQLAVSGGDSHRVFDIDSSVIPREISFVVNDLTISDGSTSGDGGGIRINSSWEGDHRVDLTMTGCVIRDCHADGDGGGLHRLRNNICDLIDCSFIDNDCDGDGGAIYNNYTNFTMDGCTLEGNTADQVGGGIYFHDNVAVRTLLVNSTLSGNQSLYDHYSGRGGGAIYKRENGTLELLNCTISANSAVRRGGGIYRDGGVINIKNCIVADNSATWFPDIYDEFVSGDYNFIGDVTDLTITGTTSHNVTGVSAGLAALGDYGGGTETMAVQASSPQSLREGIDRRVTSDFNESPDSDQRTYYIDAEDSYPYRSMGAYWHRASATGGGQ